MYIYIYKCIINFAFAFLNKIKTCDSYVCIYMMKQRRKLHIIIHHYIILPPYYHLLILIYVFTFLSLRKL